MSRSKRELRYAVEDRDTALKSRDETQADLQAYLRVVESKTKEMVAAQEVAKRAKAQAETARQEARKAKASLAELKRTSAAKNSLLSKKVAAQEDELTFLRNGWLRDIYTVLLWPHYWLRSHACQNRADCSWSVLGFIAIGALYGYAGV